MAPAKHWSMESVTEAAVGRSEGPNRLPPKEGVVGNTEVVPLEDNASTYAPVKEPTVVEELGDFLVSISEQASHSTQHSVAASQETLDKRASSRPTLPQNSGDYNALKKRSSIVAETPAIDAIDAQGHLQKSEGVFNKPDELLHKDIATISPVYQTEQMPEQHQEPLRLPRRVLSELAIPRDARAVYNQEFHTLVSSDGEHAIGDRVVGYMQQSGLAPEDLTHVWTLSDPTDRGKLNVNEFAVAMHLIFRRLIGHALPAQLPKALAAEFHKPSLYGELISPSTYSPSIAQRHTLIAPSPPSSPYMGQFQNTPSPGVQISAWNHHTLPARADQPGDNQPAGVISRDRPAPHVRSSSQPLLSLGEDSGNLSVSMTSSLVELPTNDVSTPIFSDPSHVRLSFLTVDQQASYEQLFISAVGTAPILDDVQAKVIFTRSKLPEDALGKIWNLVHIKGATGLLCPQFCLATYLRSITLKGASLPRKLPPSIKAIMSEAVNAIIWEHVNSGQPLNGFSDLSKHYVPTNTTLGGDAQIIPDRSTVDAYHTSTKEPAEGSQLKAEQPPRYSEVVDDRTPLARIPPQPSSKSAGKLPSYAKQPAPPIAQSAVKTDQDHVLCGDFYCRRCPKPVITINMIIEERLKTSVLPVVLLHPDAFLVQLRFMLNIPSDFEVDFERYPHWGDHYIALQPDDTEQFECLCLDARTEKELNMRAKPVTGSLATSENAWVPIARRVHHPFLQHTQAPNPSPGSRAPWAARKQMLWRRPTCSGAEQSERADKGVLETSQRELYIILRAVSTAANSATLHVQLFSQEPRVLY